VIFIDHWQIGNTASVPFAVQRSMTLGWFCTSVGALSTDRVSTKRLGVAIKHRSTCPQNDLQVPPLPSPAFETPDRMSRGLSRHAIPRPSAILIYVAMMLSFGLSRRRGHSGTIRSFAALSSTAARLICRLFPGDGRRTDYVTVDVSVVRRARGTTCRSVYQLIDRRRATPRI